MGSCEREQGDSNEVSAEQERRTTAPQTHIVINSRAALSVCDSFLPSGPLLSQRWIAHEYELWIVHFDTHQPHLLYSSADDCKFQCWDVRSSGSSNILRSSVFVDETHSIAWVYAASLLTLLDHISWPRGATMNRSAFGTHAR